MATGYLLQSAENSEKGNRYEAPGDVYVSEDLGTVYHIAKDGSRRRVKSKEEAEKDKTGDSGVAPNVPVELRSDELRKMFDIQRDNDVLVKAGHDKTAAPVKKHTLEETIEADPQLETGIMVIKSKLVCQKK